MGYEARCLDVDDGSEAAPVVDTVTVENTGCDSDGVSLPVSIRPADPRCHRRRTQREGVTDRRSPQPTTKLTVVVVLPPKFSVAARRAPCT